MNAILKTIHSPSNEFSSIVRSLKSESISRGSVFWDIPENIETTVTLFKDPRNNEYEDKEWHFVIEDVSEKTGKRKQVCVHGAY